MKHARLLLVSCGVALLSSTAFPQVSVSSDAEWRNLIEARLQELYGRAMGRVSIGNLQQCRPGETGSGVEVARTSDLLAIDVEPCASSKTILTFVKPYREGPVSPERCQAQTYPRIQVIQE